MNVTRAILSRELAASMPMAVKDAARAVEVLLLLITDHIAAGDTLQLRGLGTFSQVQRAERTARHPRTGDELAIPATTRATFRPAKALRPAKSPSPTSCPKNPQETAPDRSFPS